MGNKQKVADKIRKYFPAHAIYIEPFFGAGGMFFNKAFADHNFLNDIDKEVINFFRVIQNNSQEFTEYVESLPIHSDLFEDFANNRNGSDIYRAARLVYLSNYSYLGGADTMKVGTCNAKDILLKNIDLTSRRLKNVRFTSLDFRDFFKAISFREEEKHKAFIYADPPYITKDQAYEARFSKQDSEELFEVLSSLGIKFAVSEFQSKHTDEMAKKYQLFTVDIGERVNLKNRRKEILLTNYIQESTLF
jgi:DNA adenine methylase